MRLLDRLPWRRPAEAEVTDQAAANQGPANRGLANQGPAAGREADVCLFLEGCYPYVAGGVSVWVQDLLKAQSHLTFHIVALVADDEPRERKFELPGNVVSLTEVVLQRPEYRAWNSRRLQQLIEEMSEPLDRLIGGGDLGDLKGVLTALRRYPNAASRANLLNAPAAWDLVNRSYADLMPNESFLDFFWSLRGLTGGLFACLLAPLPKARLYHTVSTGYAGVLASRAALETGRPAFLTEHGIYTNERRVEIAMAEWLHDRRGASLSIERTQRTLRDLWIDGFLGYSRACYGACAEIITLYRGNQVLQERDGADPARMRIVPNGIDYARLSQIPRQMTPRRPAVALIGRVVPIKDVKTFIRSVALLRDIVPDIEGFVIGPYDEDPVYADECRDMAAHLNLGDSLRFTGRAKLEDWLGRLDVIVLTSISEAQPLVLLEAGAAGLPAVATDVGSCGELLLGREDEEPALGPGGIVTPLSNPLATATAMAQLLLDPAHRATMGEALRRRVATYYDKRVIDRIYKDLYGAYIGAPDAPPGWAGDWLATGAETGIAVPGQPPVDPDKKHSAGTEAA